MLDNGNSRTRFDTKLNLNPVLKPNIFVQIRSSFAGIFGQVLPEVTSLSAAFEQRHDTNPIFPPIREIKRNKQCLQIESLVN